ncbi:acid phosphatase (class A) [Paucibacter oligotrophus]|uniref:Acid phosphatase n=1 Tax=Roseateles oligotrophus TaxID=1769250 RepID=A0A840L8R8_9BURK|nr:phosphatase PAP2 family protein [Roseateles oligotrophus]MBB4844974.1 acid phosphatase (class A) [Roseateles oligotrophus]
MKFPSLLPRHFLLRHFLLAGLALAQPWAGAASPEWESPPISHKDLRPYFQASEQYKLLLPAPPAEGSLADRQDVAAAQLYQAVDSARRQMAEEDARWLYDRFETSFGQGPLQRQRLPILVQLLNRTLKQVGGPTFAAKSHFARKRPYQRLDLPQVCGRNAATAPADPDSQQRTSYPSGHAAYGWAVAGVLARLQAERAEALLGRAQAYAESRVICGMHFPSDVEAGRQIANAVLVQLDSNPEFQQDLQRARAELAALR